MGNAITSRIESLAGQQHDEAVEAEADAAVRRCAELERFEEPAEGVLDALVVVAQRAQDGALLFGA